MFDLVMKVGEDLIPTEPKNSSVGYCAHLRGKIRQDIIDWQIEEYKPLLIYM